MKGPAFECTSVRVSCNAVAFQGNDRSMLLGQFQNMGSGRQEMMFRPAGAAVTEGTEGVAYVRPPKLDSCQYFPADG
jgi:hypothetical protein